MILFPLFHKAMIIFVENLDRKVGELANSLVFRVRKRVFLLLAIWILLLLATLSLLSLLEATFDRNPDGQTIVSLGWAGYIVSKSFNEQQLVTAISGSWTVPKVNASAGDGYSSAWIGVGGQLDKTLIQVGTEHNALNGQQSYDAWYEMLPDYLVKIDNFVLAPGNKISASITLVNGETNMWNIQLKDITTGQGFNQNFVYNSTCSSGEWIVERSTVNGQISTLSNFNSVTFRDCQIDIGNDKGVIGNFTYSRVHMTNQQYSMLASTTTLLSNGSGFTVNYKAN
jgi:hypothetical protein